MNKKILGIILGISIVAVAGVAYFGYQKGLFSGGGISGIIGGVREDSMMGAMRKQGQPVPSKSEFIDECKKSDKESQDGCYSIGAFYYRDASFCKYIKDSEIKSQCTQEKIEEMYKEQEEMMKEYQKELEGLTPEERKAAEEQMKNMYPGGGIIPGGGMSPFIMLGGEDESKTEEKQMSPYDSAEEIAASNALASELKSIFSEVCGGVKLETLNYNFPTQGADMLVYIWKNKPTEEKLRSALVKNGYEIEEGGFSDILFVKKGNLSLIIDWASSDREEGQEIVVMAGKEE